MGGSSQEGPPAKKLKTGRARTIKDMFGQDKNQNKENAKSANQSNIQPSTDTNAQTDKPMVDNYLMIQLIKCKFYFVNFDISVVKFFCEKCIYKVVHIPQKMNLVQEL